LRDVLVGVKFCFWRKAVSGICTRPKQPPKNLGRHNKMNKKKKKMQCSAAGKIGGGKAWGDKKRRSPEHYRAMVEARRKKNEANAAQS